MSSNIVPTTPAQTVEVINSGASLKFKDVITTITDLSKVTTQNSGKSLLELAQDFLATGQAPNPEVFFTKAQIAEQEANGVDFAELKKGMDEATANAKAHSAQFVENLSAPKGPSAVGPGTLGRAKTMGPGEELDEVDFTKALEQQMALLLNSNGGDSTLEGAMKGLSVQDGSKVLEEVAPQIEAAIKANPDGLLALSQEEGKKFAATADGAFASSDSAKAKTAFAKFTAASNDFVTKHAAGKLAGWSTTDFVRTIPILTDSSDELANLQAQMVGFVFALAPGPMAYFNQIVSAIASPEQAAKIASSVPTVTIDQYKAAVASYTAEFKKVTST